MKRSVTLIVAMLLVLAMVSSASALSLFGSKEWPSSDISMTVPWNPGGVTDLTVRAASDELGKALGTNVTIVNTAGASGSVGTLAVQNGPTDGYSMLGAGLQAYVTYNVYGYTDVTFRDWTFYTLAYAPNVVVVPAESQFNTIEELVAWAQANPGQLKIGSAGAGSGGHTGAEILAKGAGFTYNHMPYESGVNAVNATLSAEVDANCQLITEVVEHVRAGKLRCLAILSDADLDLGDGIVLPAITKTVPEMASCVPMGETISYCLPKGVPEDVLVKMDEVMPGVTSSEAFKNFCASKGMKVEYHGREDSQAYVENLASLVTWTLYEGGSVTVSPETFGIPKK
ncbi:MAG: tripartite tricarboxylate transporter substrate binding protein [Eubacteriales bacterium]|nr:tripartite tricarboxylate transporter substrate binding protein [Eubacteriales bacterium]